MRCLIVNNDENDDRVDILLCVCMEWNGCDALQNIRSLNLKKNTKAHYSFPSSTMSLFHYYEQKDDVMRVNMSWIFFCIEFRRVQYKMDKHDDDMTITMTSDMACLH